MLPVLKGHPLAILLVRGPLSPLPCFVDVKHTPGPDVRAFRAFVMTARNAYLTTRTIQRITTEAWTAAAPPVLHVSGR